MSSLRNLRNADSRKWFLILIYNTIIPLLATRNAAAITTAPVTPATDTIAATNYRNTRKYEHAAAAMTAALTAAAALPMASTTTKASPRYRVVVPSAASAASPRDVRNANSAAMPIYRNYLENSDINSDKIDATTVILRDQMAQWRAPHAGSGRVASALTDESAAMTAAGFVPTTMTAAGQHYVDSMNADVASLMTLRNVRMGADFSTDVGDEMSNAVQEAGGNSVGGSFTYATPSGKIDYEFNEDISESAGNAASGGHGKSLSAVADVDAVYKYDMSEYDGFPAHLGSGGESARYGKAPAGADTANLGGGASATYYENHLPNFENYFMPTYQIEQFSNYHNQATEPAQAEEQAQLELQALELEQGEAVQEKANAPHGHTEQTQLRPLTLLNGGDGGGDDDNNAAMLQQFNKGANIENYANDRQKLHYYVRQPQMQTEQKLQQQQNMQKLQHQQQQHNTQLQQQQQHNLQQQQHNFQQKLNIRQQDNLQQQMHLQQKHLNLQQQNLQELRQNFKQQQQNSQQHYQMQQQKHKQQLLLPHQFRKLPEFLHYSLHQRLPRPQTRQVKTFSKAARPNYQDPLSTRRRRQQKRDATSLQVTTSTSTSEAARTRYSLLPTMQNFHKLDSDIAGDTTNRGDTTISSSSLSSFGPRSDGYKRSISEIFADNGNAPTQYSYVRAHSSPHVSHLIDDNVNEIDDTHNHIDDSNDRQQQSASEGSSDDEEGHDDGNTSHRDVQKHFVQILSQPKAKSYQLHNGAYTLPPITTSVRHTPASSAALAGIPLARHVEVTKHIAAVDYERIHVPYNQSVPIRIPQPIITAVPRPYAIRVPVAKTIAVPKVQEVRIPIEKVKPFPVERPVPFVVERRVPYMVEKQVAKPVYYPYPVKVPIVKTIVHKVTRRPHTYATYQPHASSYPISLGQYHLQQPHLGSHTVPSAVHYTHSTEHLG